MNIKASKSWFLDLYKDTKHHDKIAKLKGKKGDMLVFSLLNEDEHKTLQQNRAVHSLIGELYRSGLSSFNDYNECRDDFKEKAGLITREKKEEHPIVRSIQRKVYASIENKEIKELYLKSINESKETVRSVSDASKDELVLMISEVIKYCSDVSLNTRKYQEIREGLDNVSKGG